MQLEVTAVTGGRRKRCVHRCARVDDEQIAGREPARQIGEARVLYRITLEIRYEQPYLVAPQTARFRRLTCFEIGWQLEIGDHHAGCSHRASSACASKRSPLTSDGVWSNSQCQNVLVTSGSGRSEMSSCGNAS